MERYNLLTEGDPTPTLADVLASPERKDVTFAFSFHNAVVSDDSSRNVTVHLVLKFRYDESIIEDILGAEKPARAVEKRYGEAFRIFPFCIFNSVREEPISWTYQNTGGKVYERIELFVELTTVRYLRYFPFELSLLPLKVGTDGTAKTGLVNLRPELKPGTNIPNADFGVFAKATSELHIGNIETALDDTVFCRMFVRDLSGKTLGNLAGIYTRVYCVFFFQAPVSENMFKYIILSTLLLNLPIFVADADKESMVSTVLAIALSDIALIFTLPRQKNATFTAEVLIISHVLYELLLVFAMCYKKLIWNSEVGIVGVGMANLIATISTVAFVSFEYWQFRGLVTTIKNKFKHTEGQVGAFDEVDQEI